MAIRLIFFAFVDQPPVQFDARLYVSVGLAAPLVFGNPRLVQVPGALEEIDFSLLYRDLIDDEYVRWFPYDLPTYGYALNSVFTTGPGYPGFLATVFRLTPRYDFWVVRILQAMLDSLTALFLWLIMRRLISRSGAWIAAGAWSVYGTAMFKSGELVTETMAVFLAVLATWFAVMAYDNRQHRYLVAAGVTCAMLAMTKAATVAFVAPLIAGWMIANRRNLLWGFGGAGIMGGITVLALVPWMFVIYWRFGRLALRDPTYASGNFRNANVLVSEGYNLDRAVDEFWEYSPWKEMRKHPWVYMRLYVQKLYRMWANPADDYRIGFPFGMIGNRLFHRLIVVLALAGLFIWPRRAGPVAWLPLAYIGYFVALHIVMHVVSRYNLMAMPMMMGAGTVTLLQIAQPKLPGVMRRLAHLAIAFLCVCVGEWLFRPTAWLLVPGVSAMVAVVLYVVTVISLIALAVWWTWRVVGGRVLAHPIVPAVCAIVLIVLSLGQILPREGHAEWSTLMNQPDTKAERVIELPDALRSDTVGGIVLVDLVSEPYADCRVQLDIDHLRFTLPINEFIDTMSFYGKAAYLPFLEAYDQRRCDVRSWAKIPVPDSLAIEVLNDGVVTLAITTESSHLVSGGFRVFGDLPTNDPNHWSLPGFNYSAVERLYEGRDPRIWETIPLESTGSHSELVRDGQIITDDMSDDWGRQMGRFRLLLGILDTTGQWHYY